MLITIDCSMFNFCGAEGVAEKRVDIKEVIS